MTAHDDSVSCFDGAPVAKDLGVVPLAFYQECEKAPFAKCQACAETLSDGRDYFIVKSYHDDRCVVEFALCSICVLELSEEFSEDSWEAINATPDEVNRELEPGEIVRQKCVYCAADAANLLSFMRMAVCRRDRVLDAAMICERCDGECHERLSTATRDEIDRFMERILPGVPALEVDLPRLILPF